MAMLKYLKQYLPILVSYKAMYPMHLFLSNIKYYGKEKDQYIVLSELCADQFFNILLATISICSSKFGCSNFPLPGIRGKNSHGTDENSPSRRMLDTNLYVYSFGFNIDEIFEQKE